MKPLVMKWVTRGCRCTLLSSACSTYVYIYTYIILHIYTCLHRVSIKYSWKKKTKTMKYIYCCQLASHAIYEWLVCRSFTKQVSSGFIWYLWMGGKYLSAGGRLDKPRRWRIAPRTRWKCVTKGGDIMRKVLIIDSMNDICFQIFLVWTMGSFQNRRRIFFLNSSHFFIGNRENMVN